PVLALEHRWLALLEKEIDRHLIRRGDEAHGERLSVLRCCRPVLHPDSKRLCLGAHKAKRTAAPVLEGAEVFSVDVRDGKVSEPSLPRGPGGSPLRHRRRQRRTEKGELKSETPLLLGLQIAREVPPLRAELRVRAMIGGKLEEPRLKGFCVAFVIRRAQGSGDGEGSTRREGVVRTDKEVKKGRETSQSGCR